MKIQMTTCFAVIVASISFNSDAAETFTTLDAPGGFGFTIALGISGSDIVGSYVDRSGKESAFLYNGISWTTLDVSGAVSTRALGIYNDEVFGQYRLRNGRGAIEYNFLYDAGSLTTNGVPQIVGISGKNIVTTNGFYDGTSWKTIDVPGSVSSSTQISGISGNEIVGNFSSTADGGISRGFTYENGVYTVLPKAPDAYITYYFGISNDEFIGVYYSNNRSVGDHGFLYDGTTWSNLDKPDGGFLYPYGIYGNQVVGYYLEGSTHHGFLLNTKTVPEPESWIMMILGFTSVGYSMRRKNKLHHLE